MDLGLRDKRAMVTGGSSGLGAAIARALGAEGARVCVADISVESANGVVEEIQAAGGPEVFAHRCDVSEEAQVEAVFKAMEERWGGVDMLAHSAGIWPQAYVEEMTLADWQRTVDINLNGVFLTNRAFVRQARRYETGGSILNITSQAAFHGSTSGHAHYAAAKAGVVSFTISLAREEARNGIRVNALAPGMMETPMASEALRDRRDKYIERIPLGRVAHPEEVANVAIFLLSEKAGYMTGTTADVTGGMLMR